MKKVKIVIYCICLRQASGTPYSANSMMAPTHPLPIRQIAMDVRRLNKYSKYFVLKRNFTSSRPLAHYLLSSFKTISYPVNLSNATRNCHYDHMARQHQIQTLYLKRC